MKSVICVGPVGITQAESVMELMVSVALIIKADKVSLICIPFTVHDAVFATSPVIA
jgi:hypothetical protein